MALGTSDWSPWFAQSHQCFCLWWVFLNFLVPRWQRPHPAFSSFSCSSHIPWLLSFPTYKRVLQQHSLTNSPTGFCGDQTVTVWPVRWRVVRIAYSQGVSLYGSISSSFISTWTFGAVFCGDGNVYHLRIKDRREKDLRETTEGAERSAGGQWGHRRVGVWTLRRWYRSAIGYCGKQSIITLVCAWNIIVKVKHRDILLSKLCIGMEYIRICIQKNSFIYFT